MSVPTTSPLPPDAPLPVFVDESGRRRARTRIVTRALVAVAGIYVLIVIAGLTGSVSLPGVQLGQLEPVAPGRVHPGRLGPESKVLELPAVLEPSRSQRERAPFADAPLPAGVGSAPTSSPPGKSGAAGPGSTKKPPATSRGTNRTTTSSPTSTSNPLGATTTTMRHGPPTSTPHGPPSTKPGLGRGRNKL